jgi:hypothetical protein
MRYFILIALLFGGLSSCKKAETTVTREDELRAGKWKMIAGTLRVDPSIGKDTIIHYYDSLPTCKKDDYIVFSSNFIGLQNTGAKCDLSEPDDVDFRWELYNNGNAINFWNADQTFLNEEAVSAPFIEYSTSKFTIQYMDFIKNMIDNKLNDTLTYTYTFQKY